MTKRKSHYTPRVADDICTKIALGKTLKQALAEIGILAPGVETVWSWQDTKPEFAEKMERARQFSADGHADMMLEMADEALRNPSKAAAIRVASDILKWQAEIRNQKKYGSKVQHELAKAPMSPADLRAEIRALEAELGVKAVPGMNTAPVFVRKTEAELMADGKGNVVEAGPAARENPAPAQIVPTPEPEPVDLATQQGVLHAAFDESDGSPPWVQ